MAMIARVAITSIRMVSGLRMTTSRTAAVYVEQTLLSALEPLHKHVIPSEVEEPGGRAARAMSIHAPSSHPGPSTDARDDKQCNLCRGSLGNLCISMSFRAKSRNLVVRRREQ